jgi:hypothetical protein
MSTATPLVSADGIWYGYFSAQDQPGDNASHLLSITNPEAFGNSSLFTDVDSGVSFNHRVIVNVDVHADCEHDVAIERTLGVQVDKLGALLERGQSIFVAGRGNAAYQGILESGHVVRTFVSAPGDSVSVTDGYISVSARPI